MLLVAGNSGLDPCPNFPSNFLPAPQFLRSTEVKCGAPQSQSSRRSILKHTTGYSPLQCHQPMDFNFSPCPHAVSRFMSSASMCYRGTQAIIPRSFVPVTEKWMRDIHTIVDWTIKVLWTRQHLSTLYWIAHTRQKCSLSIDRSQSEHGPAETPSPCARLAIFHDASIPLSRVRRPYRSTLVTNVFALALAASIAAQSFSFHLRDVCLYLDIGVRLWVHSIAAQERVVHQDLGTR